jgi:hypothetical protein
VSGRVLTALGKVFGGQQRIRRFEVHDDASEALGQCVVDLVREALALTDEARSPGLLDEPQVLQSQGDRRG